MTRSSFRIPLAEGMAVLGIWFGAWLIHHTFQPASDTPNYILLAIGALDILLCFGLLGYFLRARLREGESLPKSWIVVAAFMIACFLGWIAALFLDSDRLFTQQQHHQEYVQQLTKLEDSLHHFSEVIPASNLSVDRNAWQVNHDRYARLHDQLRVALRVNPTWEKDLTRIDDQMQQMQKVFNLVLAESNFEKLLKSRTDFQQTRERAVQQTEALRAEVALAERDLVAVYRARWHAVGASALTGVVLVLGCLLFWLLFDRELRRSRKAQARLAGNEARFRTLVENQSGPIAVLDAGGNILYANPAWKTAFGYEMAELQDSNFIELIRAEDRPRVQVAWQANDQNAIPCRLSADYGIWHDVEMQCQRHDDAGTLVVRIHDVRATPERPTEARPLAQVDPIQLPNLPTLVYLYDPTTRAFSFVNNIPTQFLPSPVGGGGGEGAALAELFKSLLYPDDDAKVFGSLASRCAGRVSEDEFRLRDTDGQEQWFLGYHRVVQGWCPHPQPLSPKGRGEQDTPPVPPGEERGGTKILGVAFPIGRQKATEARLADVERQCQVLRDSEQNARAQAQQQRWLLDSHQQANTEGVLILSAQGEVISWNPSFVRLWKLSDETMSAHTWLTVAAHMESQVETGWDDFQQAIAPGSVPADSCWEMTLEGERTLEVYAQEMRDDPKKVGAVQFHFRDVTRHKDLETQIRGHHEQARAWQNRLGEQEEQKKSYDSNLREHEKRLKNLEKQLRERDQHHEELTTAWREKDQRHEEMEGALRDHQDRLHQMHETNEGHAVSLKAAKETTRRLASGVANDFNTVLSVVLGNTDVLHENLPKDHMAQNYVDEIRQAASRGTELSQRLLAFSRNHLLQMTPVEINHQLAALDAKMRTALGHDVQLNWNHADVELWVKTDAHPLEQALLHLVTHARQHMPHGGTLTLAASRVQLSREELTHVDMAPGAYIQVRLQDTGDGIDDETLPHVFEPYHPIKEGTKGDLTLATAYGILRQSGGCIDVASEKGKGTAWTMLLPETNERPQQASAGAPIRATA